MEYDILDLKKAIKEKNVGLVKKLMAHFSLEVKDGKLFAIDTEKANFFTGFWNQRQQARKILLNAA